MAVQMHALLTTALGELRVHPVEKWVRAALRDTTVVSSPRARLVWEPRRIVPLYAVPRTDIAGELVPWAAEAGGRDADAQRPVLDPSIPFAVHTCPGTSWTIRTERGDLPGAAFEPADPDLEGYVVLDWEAFTQWFEEDEPVMSHPHDPFSRIDCLRSRRRVVVSVDGQVLADSAGPTLLFETSLPTRFYLPREDVRMDLLEPTETHTICAYKGIASYWSAPGLGGAGRDVAWSYEEPLHDAVPVRGMVCFFTERVDLSVDGVQRSRPVTPWS